MGDSYVLDTETHNAIYSEISQRYLSKSKAQEHPCAFITGGQPGSGKSGLTAIGIEKFKESGYILVDADKLRPFHPSFKELLSTNDRMAADLTHPDCGKWASRLRVDGIKARRNIIIDQTSKSPEAMEKITTELRKAGYRVELHAMAVSPAISEQRIHQRYENQKAIMGYGRFSNKENHDDALAGSLETIALAESKKQVEKICLYNTEGKPCYENELVNGKNWKNPPAAGEKLELERGRQMTAREARIFANNYKDLVDQINAPARHAAPEERQNMGNLYKQASGVAHSAEVMEKIVDDLKRKPLPSGLKAVVSLADTTGKKSYTGKVVGLSEQHALQQIGANKFVVHERSTLTNSKDLKVGQQLSVGIPMLSKTVKKDLGRGF